MMTPDPQHTPTWRDLADEGAALEILELEDRVRDVEHERDTYRDLAREGIQAVARLTATNDRLRAENHELRERLRSLSTAKNDGSRRKIRSEDRRAA